MYYDHEDEQTYQRIQLNEFEILLSFIYIYNIHSIVFM